MITQEELKRILLYNPDTGLFTWRIRGRKRSIFGAAGSLIPDGYIKVSINHESYNDNRIKNLREASYLQNNQNSAVKVSSISGLKGVRKDERRGTWSAKIRVNGKRLYLGTFNSAEEAHEAYIKAANKYFGEFARF